MSAGVLIAVRTCTCCFRKSREILGGGRIAAGALGEILCEGLTEAPRVEILSIQDAAPAAGLARHALPPCSSVFRSAFHPYPLKMFFTMIFSKYFSKKIDFYCILWYSRCCLDNGYFALGRNEK